MAGKSKSERRAEFELDGDATVEQKEEVGEGVEGEARDTLGQDGGFERRLTQSDKSKTSWCLTEFTSRSLDSTTVTFTSHSLDTVVHVFRAPERRGLLRLMSVKSVRNGSSIESINLLVGIHSRKEGQVDSNVLGAWGEVDFHSSSGSEFFSGALGSFRPSTFSGWERPLLWSSKRNI